MTKDEQKLKDAARALSLFWHKGALKGNQKQINNQLEMLKMAAVNVLAQYAFNRSKPECYAKPTSVVTNIMTLKEEIEDEIKFLEKAEVTFHDLKTGSVICPKCQDNTGKCDCDKGKKK